MPTHLLAVLRYARREQRHLLLSLCLGLVGATLLFYFTGTDWWTWPEAVLGLATLGVGIVIWYGEAAEDWVESLPKRLTVEFWFEPRDQPTRLVMICVHAPLVGESDIRTWAIALGGQMDGGKRQLKYDAYFTPVPPEVVTGRDGRTCRHYLIRFRLEELPERVAQLETVQGRPVCLQWTEADGRHREAILTAAP